MRPHERHSRQLGQPDINSAREAKAAAVATAAAAAAPRVPLLTQL